MTNREKYLLAVDGLRAGDGLKQRTMDLLGRAREERETFRPPERAQRPVSLARAAALAAAVCLVAAGGLLLPRLAQGGGPPVAPPGSSAVLPGSGGESTPAPVDPGLPKLPLVFETGGMGYEGLVAKDVEELRTGNPWREDADLAVLPVFRNAVLADGAGAPLEGQGLSTGELAARGEEILAALGDRAVSTEKGDYRVRMKGEGYDLDLYADGSTRITFGEPRPLPDGLRATEAGTRVQWTAILDHLWPGLSGLGGTMGITHPAYDLWGDYTFKGQKNWQTEIFQRSDDPLQAILNYNFSTMRLAVSNESPEESDVSDTLWLIWLEETDLSQKVGDYPILTAGEARELLLSGKYLTTVPGEELGEGGITPENIALVELIYRNESRQEYFMPFYRFLVELRDNPRLSERGLKTYGAYYVPAIPAGYLEASDGAELFFN